MKAFRNICRILLGIVFIFSGFVKGVDPLGTVYRMNDYFLAFGMPWAMKFSLVLTILLITLEFIIGISMLFDLWIKYTSWILLPMMIYFTVLTFFDATYNIVPDCGCFGDAIKISNLQTFLKNLFLMVLTLVIFIQRKKYSSILDSFGQGTILVMIALAFASISIYSYRHLPFIDFLGWKKGEKMNQTQRIPIKFYLTFKNKSTGEEKEFLSPNYPWNDSVWMSQWVFKSQRTEDLNPGNSLALRAEDLQGNDVTDMLLNNPDYQFLWVSYDLSEAQKGSFVSILPFYKSAEKDGHSFVCLTGSSPDEIQQFRLRNGTAFEYYLADDIVLKTMVRANPGLILLHDGVVLGKWNARDVPPYRKLMESLNRH